MLKIVPQQKNSLQDEYDFFQDTDSGVRGFVVELWYRWGHALVDEQDSYEFTDLEITEGMTFESPSGTIFCDPELTGPNFEELELDTPCGITFIFDDSFTETEQVAIQEQWSQDDGRSFLDGEAGWELENRCVYVHGPVTIHVIQ